MRWQDNPPPPPNVCILVICTSLSSMNLLYTLRFKLSPPPNTFNEVSCLLSTGLGGTCMNMYHMHEHLLYVRWPSLYLFEMVIYGCRCWKGTIYSWRTSVKLYQRRIDEVSWKITNTERFKQRFSNSIFLGILKIDNATVHVHRTLLTNHRLGVHLLSH